MKEKPVSFKMKSKKIARRNIIELEKEIKARMIIKTEEWKLEMLREIMEKILENWIQREKFKEFSKSSKKFKEFNKIYYCIIF